MFKKKSQKSLVLAGVLACTFLFLATGAAFADVQSYDIDVQTITISPSSPVVGDVLTVSVSFDVISPSGSTVNLQFYIDSSLKETYSLSYGNGSFSKEFSYDSSYLSAGSHEVKIVAELKLNGEVKSSETKTTSFTLTNAETKHDLTVSATHKTTVAPSEVFGVDITVTNSGNQKESSVTVSATLNGKTTYVATFSNIAKDDNQETTIYLTAPSTTGSYTLSIKATNSLTTATTESTVTVGTTSLTLSALPSTASIGEWVRVSGTAKIEDNAASFAYVYVDDTLTTSVKPTDEAGYYSAYVQMLKAGTSTIKVKAGGSEKSATITIDGGTVTTVSVSTGTTTVTSITQKNAYVDIDVSTKELDIEQYKGNLLDIKVTNHLGTEETFKIVSNFSQDWAFTPGAKTLDDSENAVFRMFFSPGEKLGRYSGEIYVVQGSEIIKTIPLSIFVAPSPSREARLPTEQLGFIGDIGTEGYVALGGLFFALLIILAIVPRMNLQMPKISLRPFGTLASGHGYKSTPLEPSEIKIEPAVKEKMYVVPWNNVLG